MRTLIIGADLIEAIGAAAKRSYPSECCGLIEGVATKDGWRAVAIHEARNLAADPARRFLIDPDIQFRLLRALRGTERSIIGCFHSHPDGSAHPSEYDRASASEDGFLWLVNSRVRARRRASALRSRLDRQQFLDARRRYHLAQ
jgi:proteasome lid subunit RPN8/RPN11